MRNSAFKTIETTGKTLILILDRVGVIGESLALELSKDFQVVFVTKKVTSKRNDKIFLIPFKSKIPKVPNALYSKIFIVDDADKITRESIGSFIERARLTQSSIYFISSIRNIDTTHATEIVKAYDKTKVLVFGDLFDNDILLDKNSSISKYIYQVRKNKRIYIEGDGLSLNYPITFNDTIKLILKATFIDLPQKIILLFYQHPITDISLAHTFQKIDPEITADFTKNREVQNLYLPRGSQFALTKYDLKKKIEELDLESENKTEIKFSKKNRLEKIKIFKPAAFFLLACLFLFLLPLITTASYAFLGLRQIEGARMMAEKGDFEGALGRAKNAQTFFKVAKRTSSPLETQARFIGREEDAHNLYKKIETGENLANATYNLMSASQNLKNIYQGKSTDSKKDFNNAVSSFKSAYSIIQKTKAQGQIPKNIEERLENVLPIIELFSNSSDVMPQVLGFEGERNYLVLFQNNMELRPGGGFIGSVGLLTLKNGKVSKFEIQDVYSLDGQLKTHVEPPYAIRRHIPIVHLYLRDSNFDPDFVNNAIAASNIYKLETKRDVDGVIGVDLYFVQNLLEATGPVKVADYNELITSKNMYEITQKEAEENSFAGSTQKKDFLSALAKSLEINLHENKNIPYLTVAEKIGESILEKHLLFAVKDPDAQNIFSANKVSGSLTDARKNDSINDYFGISEANLGVDKINNFISRSISRVVNINEDGSMRAEATISFKNSSVKGSKLARDYKNYMQLILPRGANIQEISIGGQRIDIIPATTDFLIYERRGYRAPSALEVEQRFVNDKSIFGFLITVPPESVRSVKVSYSLPFKVLKTTKPIEYSLIIYKQPGIESIPFEQTFEIPNGYAIEPFSSFSQNIRRDQEINFTILQK